MTITAPTPTRDAHGNEISGAAEQVAAYDHALDRLLRYHPDLVPAAEDDRRRSRGAADGSGLHGVPLLMSTDAPTSRAPLTRRRSSRRCRSTTARRAHAAAVTAWVDGRWHDAARMLDELLVRWPTDVLAPADGPPARLLRRRRAEPPRPCRPLAAEPRSRPPAHRIRAGHARLRARRVRPLRAGRARRRSRGRTQSRRRLGRPRRRPRATRCRARSTTASASCAVARRRLGQRQPVHRPQLVAPRAVPPRSRPPRRGARDLRRAGPQRRVRSASRSRCSTPVRSCGGSCSTASTPEDGSIRSRTRGQPSSTASSWYVFNDLHAVIALCGAGRLDEARSVVDDLTRLRCRGPAHASVERHDDGRGRSAGFGPR